MGVIGVWVCVGRCVCVCGGGVCVGCLAIDNGGSMFIPWVCEAMEKVLKLCMYSYNPRKLYHLG